MDTKGAILKKRIKEMGYTQEKFSVITEIPLSTLKKYMTDKTVYNVETLQILAKYLDCSYEYLLGETETAKREYTDIRNATGLSDKAISRLCYLNSVEEAVVRAEKDSIDILLQDEDFFTNVSMYLFPDILAYPVAELLDNLFGKQKSNEVEIATVTPILTTLDRIKKKLHAK